METLRPQEKIGIYKNLFKGRTDVFAAYWEKADGTASGYSPVCENEWKTGLCLKLKRGKCKNCENKEYIKFNDSHLEEHLRGKRAYGIYPLLSDNSSYFISVDFDGSQWKRDAIQFLNECKSRKLPAYIERSRSGDGGHVWLFFLDKYPALKSRSIIFNILREAKIIDQFDKDDSFDRLFPNQDYLSGGCLGNLIALPLQGELRKQENTVFLDDNHNLLPFPDQWLFLNQVQKILSVQLDELYDTYNQKDPVKKTSSRKCIQILIREYLFIPKKDIPKTLTTFLREKLNFINSDYIIKRRIGLSVYQIEKYFKLIKSINGNAALPRGFLHELTYFLNEQEIKFEIIDERIKLEAIQVESQLNLYDYQKEAIDHLLLADNGILVAPPGSGKTIIGIDLITRIKQPTLILVHKNQILNQWIERIEHFLNIPKRDIGQLRANKKVVNDKITIAMIQTLSRMTDIQEVNKFGMLIVDECHHMPARMFRNVITHFNPYYLYGLTATPERKNNDAKLIFIYLGPILHKIDKNRYRIEPQYQQVSEIVENSPKIKIQQTDLVVPFKVQTDNFQVLSKILIFDSKRNQKIIEDIKSQVNDGRKCLVLTERKEHVEVLGYYLKTDTEIITMTGNLTVKQRKMKVKQIESGNFQVILATGQLIGEGTDFPNLDCLFLVFPFSFSGKLTQYIGRVERGVGLRKWIFDYRDIYIEFLEKLFKKRLRYYKKHFADIEM